MNPLYEKEREEMMAQDKEAFQATPAETPDKPRPWEQIAAGRYMPRRIRGSCLGRELG
jgi:hypothetical protein